MYDIYRIMIYQDILQSRGISALSISAQVTPSRAPTGAMYGLFCVANVPHTVA